MIRQRLRGLLEGWLLRVWFGSATVVDRLLAALVSPLTLPLSWLVAAIARRRRRRIVKESPRTGVVPVVIVGNLVAGGSGKTPLVAAIACGLVEAGFRPGLITGGYGSRAAAGGASAGSADGVILVEDSMDARQVGDESALLVEQTGLPLAVSSNRGAAADALRRHYPECDVILSDDGLQHVGLTRQVELLVIDERGFGNGRCLPAGPLREPADRVDSVDAIVLTSPQAVAPAAQAPQFRSALQMKRFRVLDDSTRWLPVEFAERFGGEPMTAIAGIARPQRFFSSLAALGLRPACHALPDHADIHEAWLAALPGRWILMTGKDAVKCRRFAPTLLRRCICVDVAAAPDAALLKWLAARLQPAAH